MKLPFPVFYHMLCVPSRLMWVSVSILQEKSCLISQKVYIIFSKLFFFCENSANSWYKTMKNRDIKNVGQLVLFHPPAQCKSDYGVGLLRSP